MISRDQTFTQEQGGEGFSTCDTNFGTAGNRSIVCYNRIVRNEKNKNKNKNKNISPNSQVGAIGLIRYEYPVLARVTEVYPSENGLVWKVVLLVTQSEKKTDSQVDPYLPPKWT